MAVDRWGRKVILLAGIGLIIAVTLSYWWFPYVVVILAIRFLHGFGWGASSTSSNTVATDVIPKERFGESMGYPGLIIMIIAMVILSQASTMRISMKQYLIEEIMIVQKSIVPPKKRNYAFFYVRKYGIMDFKGKIL